MRDLSTAARDLLNSSQRQFRFKVQMFDVLTGSLSMAQIINESFTFAVMSASGTALDVTEWVHDGVRWDDPGDRRAQKLSLKLSDLLGKFDPDLGLNSKFLMQGQVVRLIEGDESIDEEDWVTTFIGHIRGQVGFVIDRNSLEYQAEITAYGRRATPKYLKQKFISKTYNKRTEYADICTDIAIEQMKLTSGELERFPSSLGKVTQFVANSIVDMSPMEAIEKITETVGKVPEFDAEGKLFAYSKDLRRGPNKVFENLSLIFHYRVPSAEIEAYNSVSVTGLDKNITELEQPEQDVGRATIPVGFWRPTHTVKVPYSKDLKTRVRNAKMAVITSVNDTLVVGFGSESFSSPSEFEGQIEVSIFFYLISLLATIIIVSIVAAALPDQVTVLSFGVGTGITIPIGKIAQGAIFQLVLYTLSLVSSGSYEIRGNPIIPVYQEITAIVTNSNTPDYLLHQKEIHNDWINTEEELKELAILELLWETAQESPRDVGLLNDWSLEIGDVIQLPVAGGIKIWIESMSKTISRGSVPILELSGYKVPAGI